MVLRLLVVVASLVGERGFPSTRPSVASAHALSRAAPRLRSAGLAVEAPGLAVVQREGSSQTRDRTRVSCVGR